MIYPHLKVEIPNAGTRRQRRGMKTYLCVDPASVPSCPPKHQGRKSVMIGRIEIKDGREMLAPNDAYFELFCPEPPRDAKQAGACKKPPRPAEKSAGSADRAPTATGYGIIGSLLLNNLGVTKCLANTFGKSRALKLQACALYLAESGHPSFAELGEFVKKNLKRDLSSDFTREQARELFASVKLKEYVAFCREWVASRPKGRPVLFDVTAPEDFSGNFPPGKAISGADSRPQDKLAVFCDGSAGMPLFIFPFRGGLFNSDRLRHFLKRARLRGIDTGYGLSVAGSGRAFPTDMTDPDFERFCSAENLTFVVRSACDGSSVRESGPSEGCNNFAVPDGVKVSDLRFIKGLKYADADIYAHPPWRVVYFDRGTQDYSPCFKVLTDSEDKGFRYKDRRGLMRKKNCIALLTNDGSSFPGKLLQLCNTREQAETFFESIKACISDDCGAEKLKTTVKGKLIVIFVAFILRQVMKHRLYHKLNEHGLTLSDAIKVYKELKCAREADGIWCFRQKEMTKLQHELIGPLELRDKQRPRRKK